MLTWCRVVYQQGFSPQYHQVQKNMWRLWQKYRSKQDECSGSAAFVGAPSGYFLRKLLWPVCASSIRKYQIETVSIYVLLNLYLTGHFLLSDLSFFWLHHLSSVLHMLTQPSASTQYSREWLPLHNTKDQFSHSPVVVYLLWKSYRCFKLKELVYFGEVPWLPRVTWH